MSHNNMPREIGTAWEVQAVTYAQAQGFPLDRRAPQQQRPVLHASRPSPTGAKPMSTHEFIVTVDVDDWLLEEAEDRDPEDYAQSALYTAGLADAKRLDGYADMTASATITGVVPL